MATKSIYKNITAKDKKFGLALVSALERAQKKKIKEVQFSRTFSEAKSDQIKGLFGEKK